MKESKTTMLQHSSKVSIKIKDIFYTFEAMEQIDTSGLTEDQIMAERDMLWQRVHNEVDKQVREVVEGGH